MAPVLAPPRVLMRPGTPTLEAVEIERIVAPAAAKSASRPPPPPPERVVERVVETGATLAPSTLPRASGRAASLEAAQSRKTAASPPAGVAAPVAGAQAEAEDRRPPVLESAPALEREAPPPAARQGPSPFERLNDLATKALAPQPSGAGRANEGAERGFEARPQPKTAPTLAPPERPAAKARPEPPARARSGAAPRTVGDLPPLEAARPRTPSAEPLAPRAPAPKPAIPNGPRVHIGTLEVRVTQPPAPPPVVAHSPTPRARGRGGADVRSIARAPGHFGFGQS